jgi:drug/metabolite transporter (DMT)-like permease
MIASFLTTILFAISAVCANRSARMIGSMEANYWRLLFALMALGGWAYAFGAGLSGAGLPVFLLSGVIGIGVGDMGYFLALPRLGPKLSLLLVQCLTTPFGVAIEWLWLGARLTRMQIIWDAVILTGIALSLAPQRHLKLSRRDVVPGVAFGVLAALGTAAGAVLSRKAFAVGDAQGEHLDAATAAFQRIVGGSLITGVILLVVKWRAVHGHLTFSDDAPVLPSKEKWRRVTPWILGNSLAGLIVGGTCYQWAFHTAKTGIVLPIVATTPLIAIPFTMMIDGEERPSLHSLVGDAIAVAGVIGLTLMK